MNFPFASITVSPFFEISVLFWTIEVIRSPWTMMAALGIIFPVPGSIAVPLAITVVPDGVAKAVAVQSAVSARRGNRFIYIMDGNKAYVVLTKAARKRKPCVKAWWTAFANARRPRSPEAWGCAC